MFGGMTVVHPHDQSKKPAGQMKSPACSTAQAQDFAAVLVPPSRRSYTSTNSQASFSGKQTKITLCPSNSAEVSCQQMGNDGTIVDGFCSVRI